MHWLDVRGFESWPPQRLVKISYQTSTLIFKVSTFPVFHIRGALWMAIGNVLFQSALIIAAGEHLTQTF
jgi:hypothetical protein